ncbi:putative pentatricopeptide repeat-containing protein At2g01510 [Juglans microcarpa x Juglans regia]|uniref:putative pentatricopeptide repeat-containing protein At2g01510 n=1 Tax=Juglans microcarpa x Juglans regia TaxID=2249226 RepID=UPI001B7E197A|nr:putative pentatricopeptide repeat-containing protein At2g01510 [Juglans microcarpa x Juglans regia]
MCRRMLWDSATTAHVIQTYAQSRQFNKGKQLHAQLICAGYPLNTFLTNHLLNMYSKCGELDLALKLFDTMPHRNMVSWTAMITGFSQNKRFTEALETFCLMRNACESPTQFAFSSVVRAGAALGWIEFGRQMHCLSLKCSFSYELFVGSNLADMYSKCGSMVEACKVFEEMPCKDEVSWTAMIDGYAKNGDFEEALLAYKRMINDGLVIDQHVLCSTLNACGALKACKFGKALHSSVVKLGLELDTAVGNALTNVYLKVGDMENALNVFGTEPEGRNIVSYTSFINGYVEANQIEKAFDVFSDLRMHEIEPNEYTFSSLIKACANQAALEQGMQLHAQVFKFNMDSEPYVSSILVDMYGKCGLLDDSIRVFEEIGDPTEIAWNSLVSVFAQHGLGKDAIETFDRMIQNGLKPNGITFVSLLTACSHAGLADEGLKYFHSMEKIYGVVPREEHYSCVIDLLGRSGKLKEAEEFINNMPIEPNAFGWCSFLGACRTYGDKERGKLAAEKLMKLEPENSGAHVLLSNIYAKQRQWEDVRSLRIMMRDDNVKKLPGYSWVDVGNKTHIFGAEDWAHPRKKEIYEKLDSLFDQIRKAGYVPYTDSIPFDMDKSIKEKILHHHSERIALAFALISIPARKRIIVKKNIRVCVDCHSAFKCISKVVGRKIVLRDNSRFHHFADGFCSCGDYW